jgi:hypothetical protein
MGNHQIREQGFSRTQDIALLIGSPPPMLRISLSFTPNMVPSFCPLLAYVRSIL